MYPKMTVTIPDQLYKELKVLAGQESRTLSNFVAFLLQRSVDKIKREGRPSLIRRKLSKR